MSHATGRNFKLVAGLVFMTVVLFSFLKLDSSSVSSDRLRSSASAPKFAASSLKAGLNYTAKLAGSDWPSELEEEEEGDSLVFNENYKPECDQLDKASFSLVETSEKAAVIIENRKLNTLIPLILHFTAVLGPTWPVLLYTSAEHVEYYQNSPPFLRLQSQITIRSLPEHSEFRTHESVSAFLTSPWIWENLAPAKHIFMFQADSIICANSNATVDDFLIYDMVGAPIRQGLGRGFNGGLSIRNRELSLQIVESHDWTIERHLFATGDGYNYRYEDQWFAMRLAKMPEASLPTAEVAQTFSVETIWWEKPVGYHQVSRWLGDHMDEVKAYCPEIAITIGATFG